MKKKLFILALLLAPVLFLNSCTWQSNEKQGDTIIKGKIRFASGGDLYLIGYADSIDKILGKKTVLDTAAIGKDGSYRFSIHPKTANEFELKLKDTIILTDVYIAPKNKLSINFGNEHTDPVVSTDNLEGMYNDYRVKLNRKFYFEPEVKQMYYISANYLHVEQFDSFVQVRRKQQLAFFDSYFKGQKPDPEFEKYARSEINYQYGIDKMMFLWKKRIKNVDVFPGPAYYQDISDKAYLENPDALNSPAYYHFLNLYINNIYGERLVKNEIKPIGGEPIKPAVEKMKIAKQSIKEPYFYIVSDNIIASDISSMELQEFRTKNPDQKQLSLNLLKWFEEKYHVKFE
jgi:hypothetical protein